ncbi:hypothetical protein [Flagellimonas sp. 2504JD4-2]
MIKKTSNILFALLVFSTFAKAQNPTGLTAERTDNSGATLNLKNVNGFWHFSGPRSYETNNKLSIFWNDGTYHRLLSINDNGNVGIGTSSPGTKLDVSGSVNGTEYITVSKGGSYRVGMNGQSHGYITGRNDNVESKFQIHSNGNTWFDGGNVGVGTTSPLEKFQIGDSYLFHDGGHKVLMFMHGSGGVDLHSDKYAGEIRFDPVNGYLRFGTSSTLTDAPITRFSVSKEGKVGIGSLNTGSHRLAVEGSIGAREVKVEASGWSDYVFEQDYDLPTLEEVEKHIQEKGHLINIPSAKEVEENGIQLGEMNKLLLEKIEELTLYTLAQEKKLKNIKVLEQKIAKMEAIINELQKDKK